MKKLISITLTIIIALAITIPAFASTAPAHALPEILGSEPRSLTRGEAPLIIWNALSSEYPNDFCHIAAGMQPNGLYVNGDTYAQQIFVEMGLVVDDGKDDFRWNDKLTEPEMFQMVYNVAVKWGYLPPPDFDSYRPEAILSGTPWWATTAVNAMYYWSPTERAWGTIATYCFDDKAVTDDRLFEFVYAFLAPNSHYEM